MCTLVARVALVACVVLTALSAVLLAVLLAPWRDAVPCSSVRALAFPMNSSASASGDAAAFAGYSARAALSRRFEQRVRGGEQLFFPPAPSFMRAPDDGESSYAAACVAMLPTLPALRGTYMADLARFLAATEDAAVYVLSLEPDSTPEGVWNDPRLVDQVMQRLGAIAAGSECRGKPVDVVAHGTAAGLALNALMCARGRLPVRTLLLVDPVTDLDALDAWPLNEGVDVSPVARGVLRLWSALPPFAQTLRAARAARRAVLSALDAWLPCAPVLSFERVPAHMFLYRALVGPATWAAHWWQPSEHAHELCANALSGTRALDVRDVVVLESEQMAASARRARGSHERVALSVAQRIVADELVAPEHVAVPLPAPVSWWQLFGEDATGWVHVRDILFPADPAAAAH